jgi:hypothetical protein
VKIETSARPKNRRSGDPAIFAGPWIVIAFLAASSYPAVAQNLIPDPTFSSGVESWTTREVSSSPILVWNSGAGADGAPGFAQLSGVGPGATFARTCVPVEAGTTYSWGGFLQAVPPLDTDAFMYLVFYASSSCTDPQSFLLVQTPPLHASTADPNTWYLRAGPDVVAPTQAVSVAFEVVLLSNTFARRSVNFDNVYLGRQGTGPPSVAVAVPGLSGANLLVFAVLLAISAAWHLRSR